MQKKCIDCGRGFRALHPRALRCKKCREAVAQERRERFYLIRQIRSAFTIIAKIDPERAKQIMKEMEETEGAEFVRMTLGNAFEAIQSGELVPRPANVMYHRSYLENRGSVKVRIEK